MTDTTDKLRRFVSQSFGGADLSRPVAPGTLDDLQITAARLADILQTTPRAIGMAVRALRLEGLDIRRISTGGRPAEYVFRPGARRVAAPRTPLAEPDTTPAIVGAGPVAEVESATGPRPMFSTDVRPDVEFLADVTLPRGAKLPPPGQARRVLCDALTALHTDRHCDAPAAALSIGLALVALADDTGAVAESVDALAARIGVSHSALAASVRALCRCGFVTAFEIQRPQPAGVIRYRVEVAYARRRDAAPLRALAATRASVAALSEATVSRRERAVQVASAAWLQRAIRAAGMTPAAFARYAGFTESRVYALLGGAAMTLEDVARIALARAEDPADILREIVDEALAPSGLRPCAQWGDV